MYSHLFIFFEITSSEVLRILSTKDPLMKVLAVLTYAEWNEESVFEIRGAAQSTKLCYT